MLNIFYQIFFEVWYLTKEMAPYLLFGYFVAGIFYILIPKEKIFKHFSKNNISSVIKAALLGVPMPLCSCSVIPVTAHLRKSGAGKGPSVSFLTSTPTTGIDSIFATYSLLGILFAIIRPIAAFFSGILAGVLVNIFDKESEAGKLNLEFSCDYCDEITEHSHTIGFKLIRMFKYAFFDLIKDSGKWIIMGIIIGGCINYFIPSSVVEKYLGNPYLSYSVMLLIGIPMYVCATGSIPIAASLIMKGMSPGAGLVFLIAGPATNTATLTFVAGKLGKKTLIFYLISIIITSVIFGVIIDSIWKNVGEDTNLMHQHQQIMPEFLKSISASVLIILIVFAYFYNTKNNIRGEGMIIKVSDMTCEHCKKTIDSALKKIPEIKSVNINLKTHEVEIIGSSHKDKIKKVINDAGYTVEE